MPPFAARLTLAALLLVAGALAVPEPAFAGRARVRVSRPVKARARAATVAATAGALARGTAIDGPRHTGRAIRKNPRVFAAGTLLIGTMGAVAHKVGMNAEHLALALSAAAVAAQVRAAWPTLKLARGRELARRIGADVLWPAVLFGISFGAGHAIAEHGPPAHAQGAGDLATAFAASAVIGGDAPAVGVTALDTRRGGSSR
ncbi:MAG TPA: hypothetical protein VFU21_32745 [Kofleriaceae bacterium]|nr:hypothetical protein [Kofleriaceae bacterium]